MGIDKDLEKVKLVETYACYLINKVINFVSHTESSSFIISFVISFIILAFSFFLIDSTMC